jgi:nitrite reductase/ring-hydroxylating ferredoxin subunit
MADDARLICASGALAEGRSGVRFALNALGGDAQGFAVRFGGAVCAFVNRCPHLGTELDWQPGEFFEESGLYLVCSTHGAIFQPNTGYCVAGPCRGASLEPLQVRERNGEVLLLNDKAPPNSTSSSEAK